MEEVETYLRPLTDAEGIAACYNRYGVVGVSHKGVRGTREKSRGVTVEGSGTRGGKCKGSASDSGGEVGGAPRGFRDAWREGQEVCKRLEGAA